MVPLSQSNQHPIHCSQCDHDTNSLPICSQCGRILDLPESLNFFEILSTEPHWILNRVELKKRFLTLSALVHPDRFEALGPPSNAYALRWSTALNRAYQTLRNSDECTRYFLSLMGLAPDKAGAAIPADLAEAYFDVQDGSRDSMVAFGVTLENEVGLIEIASLAAADRWTQSPDPQILIQVLKNFTRKRFLQSMKNDLNKHLELKR